MDELTLIYPNKEHEAAAMEFAAEFAEKNVKLSGSGGLFGFKSYDEWFEKIDDDIKGRKVSEGRASSATFFCVRKSDGMIVGITNIRHTMNDFMLREGGHISFSIRPSQQARGYGDALLKLSLEYARSIGMGSVMVNCDANNPYARKIIEKNGGVLRDEITKAQLAELCRRYIIKF